MKVAFDAAALNERGTSVATFDYARGCALAGIEPVVLYDLDADHNPTVMARFAKAFELAGYKSPEDRARIVRETKAEVYYKLKFDYFDFTLVPGALNAVHCAFDFDRPHGDVYAYVSEWLSDHAARGRQPFVPHIVELPAAQSDFRAAWGIPQEALVVGRYGGSTTFDIKFAHAAVRNAVEARKDMWFAFVNTEKFCDHPRVLFKEALIDPQQKADYIASCDIMLHARSIGETFGLAIAEFAAGNRPFLCWAGGRDRNHIWLQRNPDFVYRGQGDLERKLLALQKVDCRLNGVPLRDFETARVIPKFVDVFLSGPKPSTVAQTTLPLKLRRKVKNFVRKRLDEVALKDRSVYK